MIIKHWPHRHLAGEQTLCIMTHSTVHWLSSSLNKISHKNQGFNKLANGSMVDGPVHTCKSFEYNVVEYLQELARSLARSLGPGRFHGGEYDYFFFLGWFRVMHRRPLLRDGWFDLCENFLEGKTTSIMLQCSYFNVLRCSSTSVDSRIKLGTRQGRKRLGGGPVHCTV